MQVPFFDDKITIGQVAAGAHFSLGLSHGGDTLYSWGRGDYGSLGIGPEAKESWGSLFKTPQRVHIPYGVWLKNIAAGETTGMVSRFNAKFVWAFFLLNSHVFYFPDRQLLLMTSYTRGGTKESQVTVAGSWTMIVRRLGCSP